MLKKTFFIVGVILIMFLFAGKASALENTAKNILVVDNGLVKNYITNAETVREFFLEQNINVSSVDRVNKNMADSVTNKMVVEIERPFIINIFVDGERRVFSVNFNDTIADMINILHEEYAQDFICEQNDSLKLRNCPQLNFSSKRVEVVSRNCSVPFNTKIVYSAELKKGKEIVTQNGINGEKIITEEVVYIAGNEISRSVKSEKVTKKSVDKIITRGTSEYKNVLVMNASAYTAGFESTGKKPGDKGYGITATGARAKRGIVAVDPKVIPLGSKLYIEGYGYATALDTGGAIKGNKIDLFYESLYEARKFGRRNIKVYMLD